MLCSMCHLGVNVKLLWTCPNCGEQCCRHIHVCPKCGCNRRTGQVPKPEPKPEEPKAP